MTDVLPALDEFRIELMMNLATGAFDLDIVDAHGETPVVAALDEEPLYALLRRVANTGGFANVFARGSHVRQVSVIRAESALFEASADDMTSEAPSGDVTVGAFLDYVGSQAYGVNIPAVLPMSSSPAMVKNPREIEFVIS